jgi:hypothetical protein
MLLGSETHYTEEAKLGEMWEKGLHTQAEWGILRTRQRRLRSRANLCKEKSRKGASKVGRGSCCGCQWGEPTVIQPSSQQSTLPLVHNLLFVLFLIIVVLGVHCDIYQSSYNTSYLNSPLNHPPLPPHS